MTVAFVATALPARFIRARAEMQEVSRIICASRELEDVFDTLSEGFELREFADGMVAEIYLCHVLEHFSFDESRALLKGIGRKLAPGGVLRLSVPSFDRLIDVYRESGINLGLIKFAMMGGQDYRYNFHKSLYNLESLSRFLAEAGYVNAVEWKTLDDFGVDLGDWSNGTITVNGTPRQISLNVKAIWKP